MGMLHCPIHVSESILILVLVQRPFSAPFNPTFTVYAGLASNTVLPYKYSICTTYIISNVTCYGVFALARV